MCRASRQTSTSHSVQSILQIAGLVPDIRKYVITGLTMCGASDRIAGLTVCRASYRLAGISVGSGASYRIAGLTVSRASYRLASLTVGRASE